MTLVVAIEGDGRGREQDYLGLLVHELAHVEGCHPEGAASFTESCLQLAMRGGGVDRQGEATSVSNP
jgi:hypothetical protein